MTWYITYSPVYDYYILVIVGVQISVFVCACVYVCVYTCVRTYKCVRASMCACMCLQWMELYTCTSKVVGILPLIDFSKCLKRLKVFLLYKSTYVMNFKLLKNALFSTMYTCIHVIIIVTWTKVVCLIYTPEVQGLQVSVHIMLQLLCAT